MSRRASKTDSTVVPLAKVIRPNFQVDRAIDKRVRAAVDSGVQETRALLNAAWAEFAREIIIFASTPPDASEGRLVACGIRIAADIESMLGLLPAESRLREHEKSRRLSAPSEVIPMHRFRKFDGRRRQVSR